MDEINKTKIFNNGLGETLFKNNCVQCHNADAGLVVGPGLAGIKNRRNEKWIISWIQNPQKVLKSGDKYALTLYEKFNKTEMTAFPNLKQSEIKAILDYIDEYNQTSITLP